jgi:hypothetical protein
MEITCLFDSHLEYITDNCYILWPLSNLQSRNFIHIFPCLGKLYPEKSGNPDLSCYKAFLCGTVFCTYVHTYIKIPATQKNQTTFPPGSVFKKQS